MQNQSEMRTLYNFIPDIHVANFSFLSRRVLASRSKNLKETDIIHILFLTPI